MLLYGQTIKSHWEFLNEDQKKAIAESIQRIFKTMKKELKSKNQVKAKISKDFEGNSTEVSNWYRRITLYFSNKGISNDQKRIEFILEKIKRGKDDQAQK